MTRKWLGSSVLAALTMAIIGIGAIGYSAQANPQPGDPLPEPDPVQECLDEAEWLRDIELQLEQQRHESVVQFHLDAHLDALLAADNALFDALENCEDFWCISDALAAWEAAADFADAVRDAALATEEQAHENFLQAIEDRYNLNVMRCNGDLA